MYWAYGFVPLFAPISEGFYWLISHNRPLADKLDMRLIAEPCDQKRSFVISGTLLLRAIGLVYLIALLSLRGQIDGLIGSQGILPAQTYFDDFRSIFPTAASRLFALPSIFWFSSSDAVMHVACNVGIVCAVLLILGVLPALNSLILWVIYLSFVIAGQMFLGYQWDALLLEAGFLAIFLSPLGLTIGRQQPSRIVMFLFRWLLFRLMLLSGLVKLASGDVTWCRLSAMRFHYQTQPLPTSTSWYMQQQPVWFATLSTGLVLIIEIAAPMFIFATRRRRIASLILLVTLQLLIAATGNYGFFNLLALVLCLTLVDDAAWRRLRLFRKEREPERAQAMAVVDRDAARDCAGPSLAHHRLCANSAATRTSPALPILWRFARSFRNRQRIRPVREHDDRSPRTHHRGQQRWEYLAAIRIQIQARRRHPPPALLFARDAAIGLADVVRRPRPTEPCVDAVWLARRA